MRFIEPDPIERSGFLVFVRKYHDFVKTEIPWLTIVLDAGYNLTLLVILERRMKMATEEEVERLLWLMHEVHPQHSFKEVDKTSEGLGAVLRFLGHVEEPVTSGQIAQAMQVSTARMAVLLKKLEGKGLIIRETGVNDARTTVVRLRQRGRRRWKPCVKMLRLLLLNSLIPLAWRVWKNLRLFLKPLLRLQANIAHQKRQSRLKTAKNFDKLSNCVRCLVFNKGVRNSC